MASVPGSARGARDTALPPWSHECEPCRRADTEGYTGLGDAAHCHDCHLTWTSRQAAHCAGCCEQFTSYSAADEHDGERGCLPPREVPSLTLAADGRTWKRADQSRLPRRAATSGVAAP